MSHVRLLDIVYKIERNDIKKFAFHPFWVESTRFAFCEDPNSLIHGYIKISKDSVIKLGIYACEMFDSKIKNWCSENEGSWPDDFGMWIRRVGAEEWEVIPKTFDFPKCECGSKSLGIQDYGIGHSYWCPVEHGKKVL